MSGIVNFCKYTWITVSILIVIGLLVSIKLQEDFPDIIKNVQPQFFDSHAARNLRPQVKSLQSGQFVHLNGRQIGQCQDFEISKDGLIYCVNLQSQIFRIDDKTRKVQRLYEVGKGTSYGIRLSRDETKLYFVNSQLGLCQYDILKGQFRSLVSQFQGEKLLSLNSIETDPENPNMLYVTQSTNKLPMYLHTIQILLNNPFGRVFQFNLATAQLDLITDGLYFPNGVVYQKDKLTNEPTLFIAQTNRHRIIRVYLKGQKKGNKQVFIDKIDVFADNMKLDSTGNLWIAGISTRDQLGYIADRTPILRKIISRLPPFIFPYLMNVNYFGGIKVSFNQQNNTQYQLQYFLYQKRPQFTAATTLIQKQQKLIMSSLISNGLLIINLQQGHKQQIPNTQQL